MTSTVTTQGRKVSPSLTLPVVRTDLVDPTGELLKNAVAVIPDVLYFLRTNALPTESPDDCLFFSTDNELTYDSFFDDFGPLNIAKVYRYCELVDKKLSSPDLRGRKVVHYSLLKDDRKFLNAAWLVGAYSILKLKRSPKDIFPLLEKTAQRPLIGFRDGEATVQHRVGWCNQIFISASYGLSTYSLKLEDCFVALHLAVQHTFFDYDKFDLTEYEHYERVENGDFNWITPKFLAFCGPHQKTKTDGYPVHAPEEYFAYFRDHNISTIVRLNSPQYPAERFVNAGFDHKDLIFPDGTSPGEEILFEFLRIAEAAKGGLAVHCKAGLGRTGTLIAAYLMKHYRFTPAQAIAWTRIARPGSVIGQQQHFLESVRDRLWTGSAAGEPSSTIQPITPNPTEVVRVSSTMTSTETIDERGFTTVVEVSVVETTVSSISDDGDHTSAVFHSGEEVKTQGDELNMRKAQRSKERATDRQTRSSCRAATTADIPNNIHPTKKKKFKRKQVKNR